MLQYTMLCCGKKAVAVAQPVPKPKDSTKENDDIKRMMDLMIQNHTREKEDIKRMMDLMIQNHTKEKEDIKRIVDLMVQMVQNHTGENEDTKRDYTKEKEDIQHVADVMVRKSLITPEESHRQVSAIHAFFDGTMSYADMRSIAG